MQGSEELFFSAVKSGNLEKIKELLDKVDINFKDRNEATALHIAVENGHTDIVKLLIRKGIDVDHKDRNEATALHIAVENNHVSIIKALGKAKANANIADKLMYSIKNIRFHNQTQYAIYIKEIERNRATHHKPRKGQQP